MSARQNRGNLSKVLHPFMHNVHHKRIKLGIKFFSELLRTEALLLKVVLGEKGGFCFFVDLGLLGVVR